MIKYLLGCFLLHLAAYTCEFGCESCVQVDGEEKCLQCGTHQYLTNQHQCMACHVGCFECLGQHQCVSCIPTFELVGTQCIMCPKNCISCEIKQSQSLTQQYTKVCKQCSLGHFMSTSNECESCPPACAKCENASFCNQCYKNYGYNQTNNMCVSCPEYCVKCDGSGCVQCSVGNVPNQEGLCVPCSSGCKLCDSVDNCTQCFPQGYLQNGTCISCEGGCIQCQSADICTTCNMGYFINSDQKCEPCPDNCSICEEADNCLQCSGGFYSDNGTCQHCMNACNECFSKDNCTICHGSYYLNNISECEKCPENCSFCEGPFQCFSCVSVNFMVLNGVCVECSTIDEGCLTCTALQKCLTCADGYSLVVGECELDESGGLSTISIVLIVIVSVIIVIAIIFGVWACWKNRSGYEVAASDPTVRSSYYELS